MAIEDSAQLQTRTPAEDIEDDPWKEATLKINDTLVPKGASLMLQPGEEYDAIVEAGPALASQLKLVWASEDGVNIGIDPEQWVSPEEEMFAFKLKPEVGKRSRGTAIFLSREVTRPWEHITWVGAEYKVLVEGKPHTPGEPIYAVRDQQIAITLMPETGLKNNSMVSLKTPVIPAPGKAESIPDFGVRASVGVNGHTWSLKVFGSDAPFDLEIETETGNNIVLKIAPGYHSTESSLASLTKTNHGSYWVVHAQVNGPNKNVRIRWSGPGVSAGDKYTDVNGQISQLASSKGRYSASIFINGQIHASKGIDV